MEQASEAAVDRRAVDVQGVLDLGFTRFITVRVVSVLYVVGLALLAISALASIVTGFRGGIGTGIFSLIVAPLGFLLGALLLRVYLEIVVVLFRIAENTSAMAGRREGYGGASGVDGVD